MLWVANSVMDLYNDVYRVSKAPESRTWIVFGMKYSDMIDQ